MALPLLRRLGFFTRVLDAAPAAERYRLAAAQIIHAESCGFDSAWVAQHHFHEAEGGLPAPLVFLAHVAAQTRRIRLGTGIITLPLELPLRVAEDTAVLDMLSGGRLEVGIGPGGNMAAFRAFGLDSEDRGKLTAEHLALIRAAWAGDALQGGDRLYPAHHGLDARVWQASFGVEGARRAGLAGDGLLLSRTQPRPDQRWGMTLAEIQEPMLDAYFAALPSGVAPRVLGSRSVFVADTRAEALRLAELGLGRMRPRLAAQGHPAAQGGVQDLIAAYDVHCGTADDVIASLLAEPTLRRATDLAVQVHSIDPPHPLVLRSIELMADRVAPALGWRRTEARNAA
jgi:putative FMN-dependent luciferase-like monooxygenase